MFNERPIDDPKLQEALNIIGGAIQYEEDNVELNAYQQLAEQTSRFALEGYSDNRLLMATLGLAGESGEVVDYIKKVIFHSHSMDVLKLTKEVGDVLWYISEICTCLDLKLESIALINLDKLAQRYKGTFSSEQSINRKE